MCDEYEQRTRDIKDGITEYLKQKDLHNTRSQSNPSNIPPGFTMSSDNIQNTQIARHQDDEKSKWINMWAMCFLTINRVPTLQLNNEVQNLTATSISIDNFLPDQLDIMYLRMQIERTLKVALIQNLAAFRHHPLPPPLRNEFEVS